jgi:hypothetical protein
MEIKKYIEDKGVIPLFIQENNIKKAILIILSLFILTSCNKEEDNKKMNDTEYKSILEDLNKNSKVFNNK